MLKSCISNSAFSKLIAANQGSVLYLSSSSSSLHSVANLEVDTSSTKETRKRNRTGQQTPSSRNFSTKYKPGVILGIETSCDDTGVAIVNHEKRILGESLNAQLQIHLKYVI